MAEWREDFAKLVSFDSVSFRERQTADWLKERLEQMGFTVWEDRAGENYDGNAGNIFGRLDGELPGAPLLFSAHMDVVEPGKKKKTVFEPNGMIRSAGNTVLGADDIAGIIEILYGISYVIEHHIPHRAIEVVFPIGEEVYIKGSDVIDYSRLEAKEAYVLDMSGDVGVAARKAPSIISFRVEVHGKASHAGFAPEAGVHAIQIAAKAIAGLTLGHLEEGTTLNIGMVEGGVATNIVPESCVCTGEIRSFRHERALELVEEVQSIFEKAASETVAASMSGNGETTESDTIAASQNIAKITVTHEVHMEAYEVPEDAGVIKHFKEACEPLGLPGTVGDTFGGSDNNNFVQNGLEGLVLSCGMYRVHSVEEYTLEKEIEQGIALVAQLLQSK